MAKEETTRSLSKRLQNVKTTAEANTFVEAQATNREAFHEMLQAQLCRKGMEIKDLLEHSNVSRNYIYNILNGERTRPGRDHVLALCIGSGMNFTETNRALESLKLAPLYPRDERDVRIAVCINQGICDVTQVNLLLDEHGLLPLQV
jgi:transcriptional regulator with XRE-family HTH domain